MFSIKIKKDKNINLQPLKTSGHGEGQKRAATNVFDGNHHF